MEKKQIISDLNKERLQNVDAEANSDPDSEIREELVNSRRARQHSGRSGGAKNSRIVTAAVLLGTSVVLIAIFIGPQKLFNSMFGKGIETQRTSNVDLKVGQRRDDQVSLDFSVPAKAMPEVKQVDPNAELNERFKALQAEMEAIQRNRQPSLSNSDIQRMMSKYNDELTRKFDEQRAQLQEENRQLREEASKSAEARKRAEEAAKAAALEQREREALEKTKRESNAVVVDQGGAPGAAFASSGGGESNRDEMSRDSQFLQTAATTSYTTAASRHLPDTSRTVVQGTIISAVLETAIDTQLPGSLRAQITEPVFSFDGSRILMPQGTIVVGQFNNEVNLEQRRVQIAWNRAITPDGKSIDLGSIGTDKLGRSGTLGNVDNRYARKFSAAVLISSISAIPAAISTQVERRKEPSENSTIINVGSGNSRGGGDDIGSTISKSLGDQAKGALEQYMNLPPIIRVPQGEEVRIFVNRDLVFR
ncbi:MULTISPECIES: TrbI/VirB10 family protein [Brucella/Ochrobactrum group]|uniref:TrbI/VirB10 family protein n=1 Tax=Brucella/Ochrobactrum group TaxID=2826938 RepID=UPI001C04C89E|nr:TrbI/VirB10 family protein [Brucella sp. NBRC 12950]QWK80628.1 TrbI/VirB10 family protein [Ochrobactrum sp. BTU1]GLU27948.1 hypothetical protein Brsp01_31810 [Brucella sp. NBRC 12950]